MVIPEKYQLKFHPLHLKAVEALDFESYPILTVETNGHGFQYLSYLVQFVEKDLEQRLLIPVSTERLALLKAGELSLKQAFETSELNQVFCIFYKTETGEPALTYLMPLDYFKTINPIQEAYQIQTVTSL